MSFSLWIVGFGVWPLSERALEGPAAGLERQAAAALQTAVAAALVACVADLSRCRVLFLADGRAAVGHKVGQRRARFQACRCQGGKPAGSAWLEGKLSCSVTARTSGASLAPHEKGPPQDRTVAIPWRALPIPGPTRARPFSIPAKSSYLLRVRLFVCSPPSVPFRPACSLNRPRRSVTPKASTDSLPPPPLRLLPAGATRRRAGLTPAGDRRLCTAHTIFAPRIVQLSRSPPRIPPRYTVNKRSRRNSLGLHTTTPSLTSCSRFVCLRLLAVQFAILGTRYDSLAPCCLPPA